MKGLDIVSAHFEVQYKKVLDGVFPCERFPQDKLLCLLCMLFTMLILPLLLVILYMVDAFSL